MAEKQRVIQEYVPGKQITLAHIIANPDKKIYKKLGLVGEYNDAIGILTITPSEGAIIASDMTVKAADVEIGFVDRFTGSVIIVGDVSSVNAALSAVLDFFGNTLGFAPCGITRS
jgi:ethanolamine utilization protein EutS